MVVETTEIIRVRSVGDVRTRPLSPNANATTQPHTGNTACEGQEPKGGTGTKGSNEWWVTRLDRLASQTNNNRRGWNDAHSLLRNNDTEGDVKKGRDGSYP